MWQIKKPECFSDDVELTTVMTSEQSKKTSYGRFTLYDIKIRISFFFFFYKKSISIRQCFFDTESNFLSHLADPSITTPTIQDTFWPYVYRVVGIMVFVIIVITICVITKSGCKGEDFYKQSKYSAPLFKLPAKVQICHIAIKNK